MVIFRSTNSSNYPSRNRTISIHHNCTLAVVSHKCDNLYHFLWKSWATKRLMLRKSGIVAEKSVMIWKITMARVKHQSVRELSFVRLTKPLGPLPAAPLGVMPVIDRLFIVLKFNRCSFVVLPHYRPDPVPGRATLVRNTFPPNRLPGGIPITRHVPPSDCRGDCWFRLLEPFLFTPIWSP